MTIWEWFKKNGNKIGFAILAFFTALGIYNQSQFTALVCRDGNEVRSEVTQFIEDTLARSRANAEAVVNSPSSSPEQKRVAEENLEKIERFSKQAEETLGQKEC